MSFRQRSSRRWRATPASPTSWSSASPIRSGDEGSTPWYSRRAGAPLTEQQVIEYAKSRLAPYKAPKTVEFVDKIPRTAATKVNRSALIAARGG